LRFVGGELLGELDIVGHVVSDAGSFGVNDLEVPDDVSLFEGCEFRLFDDVGCSAFEVAFFIVVKRYSKDQVF
tara:strand:+ start:126 stop:344 length:219 start_codon:yes stop_codon:yes gene_type:complete